MSFSVDLRFVYNAATEKRLQSQFLEQIIAVFNQIYGAAKRPLTETQYRLYLKTCLDALLAFTDAIHPACLELPPTTALFKTVHHLRSFILLPPDKDEKEQFQTGQYAAYKALVAPFKQPELKLFLNWKLAYPVDYLHSPDYPDDPDDKAEQRSYERKKKDYDKASETCWELTSPLEYSVCGTPLYPFAENFVPVGTIELPFEIPEDIRFRGVFCCAPQGRGKSNLLRTMVEDDRKKKGCVILMDAKGDLIDCYRDKAFVIQPSLINPPQINPLALGSSTQAIDLLEYIFSSVLENELTAGQSTIFHAVLSLATLVPNANISTVTDILRNGHGKYLGYMKLLDKEDRTFFLDDWNEKNYKERRPQIIQRIRYLTRNPYIRAMLNTTKNTIDFGKLMDGQNLVVIDNSYDPDMLGDLGCEFFGRLVIALIRAAAFKRAALEEKDKNPVYFYIDEAHTVIKRDATIASILRQCRSQKIAMTFANQALMDYEEHVRSALMDCGVFMVNPGAEAPHWVQRLNLSKEGVDALRNLPTHTFATYVETVTPSAVNISVDWLELPKTRRKKEIVPVREPEPPEEDVDSPLSPSEKY